jgi:EAL domain-containing protein (putative c-di-GMP-specific phosphodiesterase class I)
MSLATGKLAGAEALVRWRHPELGVQEPASFMSVAEDTGLIFPIGEVVLRAACQAAMQWSNSGLGDLTVSVNLSPREFRGRSLLPMVSQALVDSGLDAERLQVEITEASLMRDAEKVEQVMSGLRTMGVRIALDNFGTGFSSLSNLRRFPVDIIKVDGQFVRSAPVEPADAKIVAAIVHLAHELGLVAVAEGIEQKDQLEFVKSCGCDEAQGFLLGRPLSGLAFIDLAQKLR